jgi:hypothetical protein
MLAVQVALIRFFSAVKTKMPPGGTRGGMSG